MLLIASSIFFSAPLEDLNAVYPWSHLRSEIAMQKAGPFSLGLNLVPLTYRNY